ALLSLLSLALCASPAPAAQDEGDDGFATPLAETTVGMEATLVFEHERADLELEPPEARASLLARIARKQPTESGATRYELRFLAVRPGDYDLAEHFLILEGRP